MRGRKIRYYNVHIIMFIGRVAKRLKGADNHSSTSTAPAQGLTFISPDTTTNPIEV